MSDLREPWGSDYREREEPEYCKFCLGLLSTKHEISIKTCTECEERKNEENEEKQEIINELFNPDL